MDVCDFGKKKAFKYFSSPFALFPANLHTPHFCFVIWGRISSHTFSCNSLDVAKSELFLLPSAEQPCLYALSQTHKWHTLVFRPPWSPEKEKTLRERMGPGVSQMHRFYSIATSNGAGLGLFWGMKPSLAPAVACPSMAGVTSNETHTCQVLGIKFRADAMNGSRTASSDFVLYHIRLQVLYTVAMPGYVSVS